MSEFFRPVRRKLGTVTLIIACVLTFAWVRASIVTDFLVIPRDAYAHVFGSGHRGITWIGRVSGGQEVIYSSIPASFDTLGGVEFSYRWQFLGFECATGTVRQNGIQISLWTIPHWFPITTLTALSALLLLSKPRLPQRVDHA